MSPFSGHTIHIGRFQKRRIAHKTHEIVDDIEVYRPKLLDLTSTFHLFADNELRNWGSSLKFFADVIGYSVMSASQLVNNLVKKKKRKFDVIDAHDWLGIMGGIIAKKELGVPLIFHVLMYYLVQ